MIPAAASIGRDLELQSDNMLEGLRSGRVGSSLVLPVPVPIVSNRNEEATRSLAACGFPYASLS